MNANGSLVLLAATLPLLGATPAMGADVATPTGVEAGLASPALEAGGTQAAAGIAHSATSEVPPDGNRSAPAETGTARASNDPDHLQAAKDGHSARDDSRDALAASVSNDAQLADQRGGTDSPQGTDLHLNQNNSEGTVAGNVASQLTTGSNSISEGAFSNSSGIPIVIQNSGNNVLIQNSTILNLQLATPQ